MRRNCSCGALMDGTMDLGGHRPECDAITDGAKINEGGVQVITERDVVEQLPEFLKNVETRLEKGRVEYGDANLNTPMPQTLAEMMQEMEDQAGWGFINWLKIKEMIGSGTDPEFHALRIRMGHIEKTKAPVSRHSHMKRVTIMSEELGEVARAVLQETPDRVYNELVDLAAFAMLWAKLLRNEADEGDEVESNMGTP